MNLESSIQIAGALQLIVAVANFFLPTKLNYRENLAKVSPIIRQIFTVHSVYIVLVLIGFGLVCLLFPKDLCGASPLGRFLCGFLASFWGLRVVLQFGYYDKAVKKDHPLGAFIFGTTFLYLAMIFTTVIWFCAMNPLVHWLSLALWLAGIGHFCVLIASFQVPSRLGWKKDLAQLTPFNRKLMWVYAGTTLLTIIAFGILTLILHHEFLAGDRATVALAAFIAIFWTLRIVIDFFYFEHADWPTGLPFVVGHFFLTALFTALASTYWAVLIWSFVK